MLVIFSRTKLITFDARVRKNESWRFSRQPPTKSCPALIFSSSFGISSGGFWRSASRVTMIAPRHGREKRKRKNIPAGVLGAGKVAGFPSHPAVKCKKMNRRIVNSRTDPAGVQLGHYFRPLD